MQKKTTAGWICAVLMALGGSLHAPSAAYGAGTDEFYVNTLRSIGTVAPKGPRSMAMGGTGRGLADGIHSLGMNPAALGAVQGIEYDIGLGFDWLDDGYDDTNQVTFRLGGAVNLDRIYPAYGPNQAVAAMLSTQNYSGAANMGMKRDQVGFTMGYGLQLSDDLLAGVSVSLFDGKWKSDRGTAPGEEDGEDVGDPYYLDRRFTGGDFRFGGLYRLSEETTVGGAFNYATGSLRERADYAAAAGSGSLERFGIGVGVAHQYAEHTMVMGDLWYDRVRAKVPGILRENDSSWGLAVGVEQAVIPEMVALRGGLYYDHTSFSRNGYLPLTSGSLSKGRVGFTAGIGVRFRCFNFSYSLDINSGGDVKNLLDVSTEW